MRLTTIILMMGIINIIVCAIRYYEYYFTIVLLILSVYRIIIILTKIPNQNSVETFIEDLPIYTILAPMYKENIYTIRNFIVNLNAMNYTLEKLNIIIILEENDASTVSIFKDPEIEKLLNNKYQILIVPNDNSMVKTKARALNYALDFIKGEYVVVYDAEDIPHQNQLLIALSVFEECRYENIVIQFPLKFYNNISRTSNILQIEYDYLFQGRNNIILKYFNIFFLGGTSNHIKSKDILNIKWDALNVTEDAKLSIDLFFKNFHFKHIRDVPTLEESVVSPIPFIRQRSRWIKGFLQTYHNYLYQLFFNKKYKIIHNNLKTHAFLNIYFIYIIIAPIVSPMILIYTICSMNLYGMMYIILDMLSGKYCYEKFYGRKINAYILFYILYYGMYIMAYFKALYEIFTNAGSYWDKTMHSGRYI